MRIYCSVWLINKVFWGHFQNHGLRLHTALAPSDLIGVLDRQHALIKLLTKATVSKRATLGQQRLISKCTTQGKYPKAKLANKNGGKPPNIGETEFENFVGFLEGFCQRGILKLFRNYPESIIVTDSNTIWNVLLKMDSPNVFSKFIKRRLFVKKKKI